MSGGSDDWVKPPANYTDLEHRAEEIYQFAWECAQAESGGTAAKFGDLALKAINVRAALREKTLKPAQISELQQQLDRVERRLSAHHAGDNNGAGAKDSREGTPPPWRQ
jgi:hypothetical protein